eukprot:2665851-Pyramimonas_sp.AAC.1
MSMVPEPTEQTDSPWTTSNLSAAASSKSLKKWRLEHTCRDAPVSTLNRSATIEFLVIMAAKMFPA